MLPFPNDLGPGDRAPDVVNAFIEIPKRSRNKYELDHRSGLLALNRYLYASSHYPGDYGFIPRTIAEDGDALDVLVIVNEPTFPGCLIEMRVLGVFRMTDQGKADHKVLGVPDRDPHMVEIRRLQDLQPPLLREIEHFFRTYKQLEELEVVAQGWGDASEAKEVIRASVEKGRNGPA